MKLLNSYNLFVNILHIHKRSTCWQLSRKWAQERNWLGWVRHWEPYGGPGMETPTPQPLPKGIFLVFWGHVELFLSNNTWCIICVGLGVAMPLGRLRWFLWPTTTMHDIMHYPMLTKHISKKEFPIHKELKNNNNNKMLHSVVHYQCIFKESIQWHTSPTLDCHCTGHMTELVQ